MITSQFNCLRNGNDLLDSLFSPNAALLAYEHSLFGKDVREHLHQHRQILSLIVGR